MEKTRNISSSEERLPSTGISAKRLRKISTQKLKNLVHGCYERAKGLLSANIDTLHAIANGLLEKETLDGPEIDIIIKDSTNDKEAPVATTDPPSWAFSI